MNYQVIDNFTVRTPKGIKEFTAGQIIPIDSNRADILIEKGKIEPLPEPIDQFEKAKAEISERNKLNVSYWLDKLDDYEREIYEERAAIMEFDGSLARERAEVEAIKIILQERIIKGKCDVCSKVDGCIMTKGQREICKGDL